VEAAGRIGAVCGGICDDLSYSVWGELRILRLCVFRASLPAIGA
jgi:hypothetical protein